MKRLMGLMGIGMMVAGVSLAAGRGTGGGDPGRAIMDHFSAILKSQSFSATMVFSGSSARQKTPMPPMEGKFLVLQGMVRMEMDMTKAMAAAPGRGAGELTGMEKMIVISRPDKKVSYLIMPGLQAYCEMAFPKEAAEQAAESAKIDRTAEGSETLEGYACEKFLNTVTAKDGKTAVIHTWEAKDLGGMPIKMTGKNDDGEATLSFKDIKTGKPDASLFEPPADYQKYDSPQAMMMSGVMKMMKMRE